MEKTTILAIDDDKYNLDILRTYLTDAGYSVITAGNGEEGWDALENVEGINLIILDRMMPVMNGLAFMKKLKLHKQFANIPVIMQTAAATNAETAEGINSGVFYYLTKPYYEEVLLAIVRAALEDKRHADSLLSEMSLHRRVIPNITHIKIRFRTLSEVNEISSMLANIYPEPERVIFGINEMMTNAVEHGNLGITYSEKATLTQEGKWQEEIEKRLAQQPNKYKVAEVELEKNEYEIILRVRDQGPGFAWQNYLMIAPERATHISGRGIALAKLLSFDDVEYKGSGNEVVCRVQIAEDQGKKLAAV